MTGDVRIRLSALWVSLMLTYLLGDVLRIFSGDFQAGEIGGMEVSQGLYLALAALLVIPIVMVPLSLTLKYRANRWLNLILPVLFFAFNAVGLPTYPSAYDKFLIVVGLAFNGLTVWCAWKWRGRKQSQKEEAHESDRAHGIRTAGRSPTQGRREAGSQGQ